PRTARGTAAGCGQGCPVRNRQNRSGSILLRTTRVDLGVSQAVAGRSSSQGDGRPLLGEPRVIERALIDYYRCPEEFVTMSLAGELSPDSGYFRFGRDICYGQTSCGLRGRAPANGLYDTLPAVTTEEGVVRVPFDPSQVIDNLRLERYA